MLVTTLLITDVFSVVYTSVNISSLPEATTAYDVILLKEFFGNNNLFYEFLGTSRLSYQRFDYKYFIFIEKSNMTKKTNIFIKTCHFVQY